MGCVYKILSFSHEEQMLLCKEVRAKSTEPRMERSVQEPRLDRDA